MKKTALKKLDVDYDKRSEQQVKNDLVANINKIGGKRKTMSIVTAGEGKGKGKKSKFELNLKV